MATRSPTVRARAISKTKMKGRKINASNAAEKTWKLCFTQVSRKVPKVNRGHLQGKTKGKSKASEEGDDIELDKVLKVRDTVLIKTSQPRGDHWYVGDKHSWR
jgi:hypothetical protein